MITCPICEAHKSKQNRIAETEHWILRKAPADKNLDGYCYLESKNHIENWLSLSLAECQDFGNILHKGIEASLVLPSAPDKVYFAGIAEAVPHIHMHLVPRYPNQGKGIGHLEQALGPGFSKAL
jgi:diadenosine tetraphosphate (Ap4A) HIT family hydrolase